VVAPVVQPVEQAPGIQLEEVQEEGQEVREQDQEVLEQEQNIQEEVQDIREVEEEQQGQDQHLQMAPVTAVKTGNASYTGEDYELERDFKNFSVDDLAETLLENGQRTAVGDVVTLGLISEEERRAVIMDWSWVWSNTKALSS
jgi:hypothetical protein